MHGVFDAISCISCQRCVPVHKSVLVAGLGRKCMSCVPPTEQSVPLSGYDTEPIVYCSTPETPKWVEAIGVVHFDLLLGQVLDAMYPPLPFSAAQETELSFLCFPDANHVADGDSVHDFVFAFNLSECDASRTFTTKRDRTYSTMPDGSLLPPLSSSSAEAAPCSEVPGPQSASKLGFDSTSTELFCSTLFRQKKDSSVKRGAQQHAILILSRYPFPSVAHQILRILCSQIFDAGADADPVAVVQEAYNEISAWPPTLPTNTYRLRLLGRDLSPYTTPIYSATDVEHLRWSETTVRSARGSEAKRALVDALTRPEATLESIQPALNVFVRSAGCPQAVRRTVESIMEDALSGKQQATSDRAALVALLRVLIDDGRSIATSNLASQTESNVPSQGDSLLNLSASFGGDDVLIDSLMRHFRLCWRPRLLMDVAKVQNEALCALQRKAHTVLTSPTLTQCTLKASGPQKGRHWFHDLEFHHAMYPHLPKLWKLWELLIVGAPLCVVGPDAPTVTASCLSLSSLIAPLRFTGVVRPYLTINNREVDLFVKDVAPPSMLVGVTNPFFVRRCAKWPHLLCISKDGSEPMTHKMLPADSEKREKQQFKLKNRMFCSRHYLIKTEKSLSDVTGAPVGSLEPPSGKSSFVDLNPTSAEGHGMRSLRQHFLDLTEEFLAPLQWLVRDVLRRERPFFIPNESERLLSPDALVKGLGSLGLSTAATGASPSLASSPTTSSMLPPGLSAPPLPLGCFKNRADMITVYREFLQTNTARIWLQAQYDAAFRDCLLSVSSLEEVLLLDPDPSTRHLVLQTLQDELERVLERPLVDLNLVQKLSALCSLIPALRLHIASPASSMICES